MPESAPKTPLPRASGTVRADVAVPTWARRWVDGLGRPASGTVSLTRIGAPALVVTGDLDANGWVKLPLTAGRYRMVAALKDADGARFYDTDIFVIT
jgi:hypothetical protein